MGEEDRKKLADEYKNNINNLLDENENMTLDDVRKKLNISKKKLSGIFKDLYKFNRTTKRYESIYDDEEVEEVEAPIKEKTVKKNELELILTLDQQQKIIDFIENHNVNDVELKIEMPLETIPNYKITTRVNNKIWEKFNKFCKRKKYYNQKDHLGRALIMYMKNTK